MASLVSRIRSIRQSEHFKRLWKYASVSIVSTIVSQVVLFVTYHVYDVGHSAMVCNVIATAVASLPAYYLNRTWTWGKTGRSRVWREVVPFWTISFSAMVISTAAVGVAAHNADRIASGSLNRALIVNGANLLTYACIWTVRYLIFNRYLFGARSDNWTRVTEHEQGQDLAGVTEIAITGEAREPEPGISRSAASELEPGISRSAPSETIDPAR
jgi:putative flippase GtrA